jgi:hypothetical protein
MDRNLKKNENESKLKRMKIRKTIYNSMVIIPNVQNSLDFLANLKSYKSTT